LGWEKGGSEKVQRGGSFHEGERGQSKIGRRKKKKEAKSLLLTGGAKKKVRRKEFVRGGPIGNTGLLQIAARAVDCGGGGGNRKRFLERDRRSNLQ